MIQKHLTATVLIAVAIIIFHSSILNALVMFLMAGVLPLIPVSLPSWMMLTLASIALVIFIKWVVTRQLYFGSPRWQALHKKAQPKGVKRSRPKPKPAS